MDCRKVRQQLLKQALAGFLQLLLALLLLTTRSHALSIGIQPSSSSDSASPCSRTCESEHCMEAPLLRYGKYCGVSYTGCPGEAPCDALDGCCMFHDACVQATDNDYLNTWCNQNLLNCVAMVKADSSTKTFEGNQCNMTDVADEITSVVEAAVFAKRILRKP